MEKEKFISLVEKYKENQCTEEERQIVEDFFEKMQLYPVADLNPSNEKGKVLSVAIKKSIGIQKTRRRRLKSFQIAAVFFLIAGLTYTLNLATSNSMITAMAAKGERKEVKLQDGSLVVLNSNSSIIYPESFGKTREIELNGEAYFKVHRDTSKPFIVKTHDLNVKVLGTSFNINSYNQNYTKVSVVTGKVLVASADGKKRQLLTKDQQVSYSKESGFNRTQDDSSEGIAWTQNTIFLKNTTLAETAKTIENWYDVKVDFEEQELKTLLISGKFKDEKLENVLNSIAVLKELEIKYLTKNHVLIRKKRQSI